MSHPEKRIFVFFFAACLALVAWVAGCGGDGNGNGESCADHAGEFCVESSDKEIFETHSQSFDWTSDKIAIRHLIAPTRSEAEKALYFQNPGLYMDPSGEPQITPDPLPTLDPSPTGFDFPLSDLAPNSGQQLLDNSTLVDSLGDTSITADEQAAAALWLPAVMVYLSTDWDAQKVLNLYYGNTAVKGQDWGQDSPAPSLPPQTIQHLYLHDGELWVEIAFEDNVDLGTDITDSNGDGYREVFGQIAPAHFTSEVYDELANNYVAAELDVDGLKTLIEDEIIDDLYFDFPMQPYSGIGESFEVPGAGTIVYPFMVVQGVSPKDDIFVVLIVEP